MSKTKTKAPKKAPPKKAAPKKPSTPPSSNGVGKDPKTGISSQIEISHVRGARFWPRDIIADFNENVSRSCLYTYEGKPCCFSADEPKVVERMASLLKVGQRTAVDVWFDNLGRPHLANGYLRLFCFLLLTADGRAKDIPRSKGGMILTAKVEQPQSPEQYLALADINLHDNMTAPPTDVDVAYALRSFSLPAALPGGRFGLGNVEAGRRVAAITGRSLGERTVAKYLQLLSLPPMTLGRVHRGEISMTVALKEASTNGLGTAKGPRPGWKKSQIKALAAHLPQTYSDLCRFLLGEIGVDEAPPVVQKALAKLGEPEKTAS